MWWLLSGVKRFRVFGIGGSFQGGTLEQSVVQRAAQTRLCVFSLVAMRVAEREVEFRVEGFDRSLAVAAQKLMKMGKIEAMREHVKFGERRSAGDCLPVPLYFSDEERELRELRVIPWIFVKEEVVEMVHPIRESDDRGQRIAQVDGANHSSLAVGQLQQRRGGHSGCSGHQRGRGLIDLIQLHQRFLHASPALRSTEVRKWLPLPRSHCLRADAACQRHARSIAANVVALITHSTPLLILGALLSLLSGRAP